MAQLTHGTVSITYPDHITLPERAGKLTPAEVARLEKPRRGLGLACEKTAEAIKQHPAQLAAAGVDPEQLRADGRAAEDIDTVIHDLEALLTRLKQANSLLDEHAHRELRRVLAHVRAQQKFDPSVPSLVPLLVAYFANARETPSPEEPTPAG